MNFFNLYPWDRPSPTSALNSYLLSFCRRYHVCRIQSTLINDTHALLISILNLLRVIWTENVCILHQSFSSIVLPVYYFYFILQRLVYLLFPHTLSAIPHLKVYLCVIAFWRYSSDNFRERSNLQLSTLSRVRGILHKNLLVTFSSNELFTLVNTNLGLHLNILPITESSPLRLWRMVEYPWQRFVYLSTFVCW